MKFLLLSLNYSPELTGIGKYNGELAPWLVDRGHEVTVICAPPYYPEWRVHQGYKSFSYSKTTTAGLEVVRCPLYVPAEPATLSRIIHLASFAFSSGFALLSRVFQKPDIVFLVQPTLFCAPAVLLYCWLTGAKSVLHIQDYEVDAMFGLGLARSNGWLSKLAVSVERWIMSRFDVISTISFSMIERAKTKGVSSSKLLFFPNWSDTDFVTPTIDGSTIRSYWGLSPDQKLVLYAGNVGEKQGLELVLHAAQHYSSRPEVQFFIVGAGGNLDKLKALAEQVCPTNLHFKPLVAWADVPAMLSAADVHLVIQKKGAADAVLPSKLTNILSAGGQAVVTAESHTELGRLAAAYPGIFNCVEPEDLPAFIAALDAELSKSDKNIVARNYAEQNLNKEAILSRFQQDLTHLIR